MTISYFCHSKKIWPIWSIWVSIVHKLQNYVKVWNAFSNKNLIVSDIVQKNKVIANQEGLYSKEILTLIIQDSYTEKI